MRHELGQRLSRQMKNLEEWLAADPGSHLGSNQQLCSAFMEYLHTLHGMALGHLPPQLLLENLMLFIFSPLRLLYSLIVIVYSYTQNLLCSLLPHDKVIEMLL